MLRRSSIPPNASLDDVSISCGVVGEVGDSAFLNGYLYSRSFVVTNFSGCYDFGNSVATTGNETDTALPSSQTGCNSISIITVSCISSSGVAVSFRLVVRQPRNCRCGSDFNVVRWVPTIFSLFIIAHPPISIEC